MAEVKSRGPLARHANPERSTLMRRVLTVLGVGLAVLTVSALAVSAFIVVDLSSRLTQDATVIAGHDVDPPDIGELDNTGVNILLAGLDICEDEIRDLFQERCEDTGQGEAALNDVTLVLHISPEPRRVTVITFPRDLMIDVPECTNDEGFVAGAGSYSPLNAAFGRGGLDCVVRTVEGLSGLNIDYGATVTWGGVIDITDAVGGVNVCVGGQGIYDDHTGLALGPGMHELQGLPALQFLRTRNGVDDGSDLARIGNQQVYMVALVRKLTQDGVLTNPGTLLRLARTTMDNVDPSTSLTNPITLAQIAGAAADVPMEDYVFVQYPVFEDPNDRNKVIPDFASAEQLWQVIEANEPLQLADGADSRMADDEDDSALETAEPTDGPTPGPTDSANELGQNISGTDSSEERCSAGRG